MVNVGGRSKGCSTCRRRRVKCDETRPVCNRCQRCGYDCDGPKDATFIVAKIVRSRRRVTGSLQRDTGSDERAEHRIALSPPLTGNEFELYLCYSRTRLRPGAAIDLVMQNSNVGDLVTAGTKASSDHVFPRTLLSFATIVYGAQHRQASITNKGYALHGSALKQLNRALSDSSCHTQDEVLLSVATLAILECLVPTGSKNYLNHMLGLEKLLALRDPREYSSPLSLELYKSVRHMILFASLHTGRPSILAKLEWKKVLRASCLEQEMQEQDLFDILADCTVLAAGRDKVLANRQLDAAAFSRLRDRMEQVALCLQTQLCTWRQRWGSYEWNGYSEVFAPTQESDDSTSPPPLTFFEFENESASIMLMFYNTTLIYILRILASLQLRDPNRSYQLLTKDPSEDQEAPDGAWKSTKNKYIAAECSAALDVCRCVSYYSACTRKHTAPIVHWSVTTAWTTLASNESTEARSMMAYISTKCREVIATGLWTG